MPHGRPLGRRAARTRPPPRPEPMLQVFLVRPIGGERFSFPSDTNDCGVITACSAIIFVVTMSVRSTYSVGRANVVVKRYQYARYQRPRTTAMLSSIPGGPSVCEGGVKSKAESPSPALIRFIASPPRLLTQPAPYLGCPPYASHGRHVNVQ